VSERLSRRPSERLVIPVGALLTALNALLEEQVGRVWIIGQVSNLHRASSGHTYFTLKDEQGQVRAALFRSAARRVPFDLEEGLEIVVCADVGIYALRGDLQLVVREVEPRGQGGLQLAFEQLRQRLEAEGLFDPDRKRELPAFPGRLGVVTSPTSAAVRDVIQVARHRFPAIPLLISPTRVQGQGVEEEIATALDVVGHRGDVDAVLLVRGGGTLEDLWCFNTETVARAIERCPVPVVSGVGHETDITIADLVADVRAPTPSAAAALVLPDRRALVSELSRHWRRLETSEWAQLRRARTKLHREAEALRMLAPWTRLAARRIRLRSASRALARETRSQLERRRARLAAQAARLESLSPLSVLARGYALVRRSRDGAIVRRAEQLERGEQLEIRLAEARVEARVESVTPHPRG
jgi:exodeoxyribonuclease VII large subunit